MEVVERYPKIIHQGCPDRLRVADDDHRSALPPELLEMDDHPALKCGHALAARRTRAAAPFIPVSPLPIRDEIGERRPGPPPHVDLVEADRNLHRTAAPVGDDGCRLQRPSLRARLHGQGSVAPEYLGRIRHLMTTELIQWHARHPSAED